MSKIILASILYSSFLYADINLKNCTYSSEDGVYQCPNAKNQTEICNYHSEDGTFTCKIKTEPADYSSQDGMHLDN